MTVSEFENKCAFLAQTPQERWFDLRFKAFVTMIRNSDLKTLDLHVLFPTAKQFNINGFCIKVESKYYFVLAYQTGTITEFFNVETINFVDNPYILSSGIILSSDDDSDRKTFMPILMLKNMTKPVLKTKLDVLFSK